MTEIASVVSFCTNDLRFLDQCIRGLRCFSSQIVIPICDHFYNGQPENLELLGKIYAKYPGIDFIEFAYSNEEVYGTPAKLIPGSPGWACHWHNSARLIGTFFLMHSITHVLFLDVDEIFTSGFEVDDYDAIRFATYWYFKSATKAATVFPNGPLLVKKKHLTAELLLNEDERAGMFHKIQGKKRKEYSPNEKPIVHHYSWVRPRDEMLLKVRSWGHHWERDWENLIDQQSDFVRGYKYRDVPLFFDPLKEKITLPQKKKKPQNRLTPKDFARLEIEKIIRA